jgi:hypothetical protein
LVPKFIKLSSETGKALTGAGIAFGCVVTAVVTVLVIRIIRKRREARYVPIPTHDRELEQNPQHVYIKDVIIERSVGKGRFGVVYKGLWYRKFPRNF